MNNYNMSEQIKPWTYRGGKQQSEEQDKSNKPKSQQNMVPMRPAQSYRLAHGCHSDPQYLLKHLRLPAIVQSPLSKETENSLFKQYGLLLNENFRKRFVPNYSKIRITFKNSSTRKCKRAQSQSNNCNSLKQYIQNSGFESKENIKYSKDQVELKRIKTEVVCQKQFDQADVRRSSSLGRRALKTIRISPEQEQTFKVINYGKFPPFKEETSSKAKFTTKKTQQMNKNQLQYKLSLMKRTYNLAKIQKMLL